MGKACSGNNELDRIEDYRKAHDIVHRVNTGVKLEYKLAVESLRKGKEVNSKTTTLSELLIILRLIHYTRTEPIK